MKNKLILLSLLFVTVSAPSQAQELNAEFIKKQTPRIKNLLSDNLQVFENCDVEKVGELLEKNVKLSEIQIDETQLPDMMGSMITLMMTQTFKKEPNRVCSVYVDNFKKLDNFEITKGENDAIQVMASGKPILHYFPTVDNWGLFASHYK